MSSYTFIPSSIEHPTKEELILLTRHIGHDFKSDLHALLNIGYLPLNDFDEKDLSLLKLFISNICEITKAISELGQNMKINLYSGKEIDILADYFNFSKLGTVKITSPKEVRYQNSPSVIYLELFNFIKNALNSYNSQEPPQEKQGLVELSLEELNLTAEELSSLGRAQEKYSTLDSFVRASVRDYAQGIAPDRIDKIITRTENLNPHCRNGVGLALTDYICDVIHGFVTIDSVLDNGSTFSLYFPKERKME